MATISLYPAIRAAALVAKYKQTTIATRANKNSIATWPVSVVGALLFVGQFGVFFMWSNPFVFIYLVCLVLIVGF
jgi:hypothetical protein